MKTIRRSFIYIARYPKALLLIVFFALLGGAANLMAPLLIGRAIDLVVGPGEVNFASLLPQLVVLACVFAANSLAGWFMSLHAIRLSNQIVRDMRQSGFHQLTRLPISYFDNARKGDLISRFSNDMELIGEGLFQTLTQIFSGVISALGSLAIMLWLNGLVGVTVLVVAPLAVFVGSFIAKNASGYFRENQRRLGEYNDCVEEYVDNFLTAKAYGLEKEQEEKAGDVNQRLYRCGQRAQFFSAMVNPSTRVVNNLAYMLVGLIGGLAGVAGRLTIGQISGILNYSTLFAKPLNDIAAVVTNLQAAIAAAERFFALMDEEREPNDANKKVMGKAEGKVTFQSLSFAYDEARPLIQSFSADIPAGTKVAIVGPTGAGKTTVVNLLMGFYPPDSGKILIDGEDTADFTRDSLRVNFGMVLQDVWLFQGTVRQNIAFGKPDATDAEITAAAKAARAHGFITRLKEGYDTKIRPDGGSLSQGEKQLLTIARAMLLNPGMMILDEATSNVDPLTEIQLQTALNTLMKGRTAFVIAHRLSTIVNSDIIIVMENGHIVEQGNHAALLQNKGLYYRMVQAGFSPT
jgi:ABC-type multidrug transport system, ATPase and permease components